MTIAQQKSQIVKCFSNRYLCNLYLNVNGELDLMFSGSSFRTPPKFLRSGKKECKIRAKLKNFGKILKCPENFFVFSRKLHFLVCAEKVLVPKQE